MRRTADTDEFGGDDVELAVQKPEPVHRLNSTGPSTSPSLAIGTPSQFWIYCLLSLVCPIVAVPVAYRCHRPLTLARRYGSLLGSGIFLVLAGVAGTAALFHANFTMAFVLAAVCLCLALCISPILIFSGLNGWAKIQKSTRDSVMDIIVVLVLAFLLGVVAVIILIAFFVDGLITPM